MTDQEFERYLETVTPTQATAIRGIRVLIAERDPGLTEALTTSGLICYSSSEGDMIYAVGPRRRDRTTLHLMPYYSSAELRERHGTALAPVMSGKSCVEFRTLDELPLAALAEIMDQGSVTFATAKAASAEAKRPPSGAR